MRLVVFGCRADRQTDFQQTVPSASFSAPGLEQSYSISVLKAWLKNDPGHGLSRLGARGWGLEVV